MKAFQRKIGTCGNSWQCQRFKTELISGFGNNCPTKKKGTFKTLKLDQAQAFKHRNEMLRNDKRIQEWLVQAESILSPSTSSSSAPSSLPRQQLTYTSTATSTTTSCSSFTSSTSATVSTSSTPSPYSLSHLDLYLQMGSTANKLKNKSIHIPKTEIAEPLKKKIEKTEVSALDLIRSNLANPKTKPLNHTNNKTGTTTNDNHVLPKSSSVDVQSGTSDSPLLPLKPPAPLLFSLHFYQTLLDICVKHDRHADGFIVLRDLKQQLNSRSPPSLRKLQVLDKTVPFSPPTTTLETIATTVITDSGLSKPNPIDSDSICSTSKPLESSSFPSFPITNAPSSTNDSAAMSILTTTPSPSTINGPSILSSSPEVFSSFEVQKTKEYKTAEVEQSEEFTESMLPSVFSSTELSLDGISSPISSSCLSNNFSEKWMGNDHGFSAADGALSNNPSDHGASSHNDNIDNNVIENDLRHRNIMRLERRKEQLLYNFKNYEVLQTQLLFLQHYREKHGSSRFLKKALLRTSTSVPAPASSATKTPPEAVGQWKAEAEKLEDLLFNRPKKRDEKLPKSQIMLKRNFKTDLFTNLSPRLLESREKGAYEGIGLLDYSVECAFLMEIYLKAKQYDLARIFFNRCRALKEHQLCNYLFNMIRSHEWTLEEVKAARTTARLLKEQKERELTELEKNSKEANRKGNENVHLVGGFDDDEHEHEEFEEEDEEEEEESLKNSKLTFSKVLDVHMYNYMLQHATDINTNKTEDRKYLKEMLKDFGIEPDLVTYRIMFYRRYDHKDYLGVIQLYKHMKKNKKPHMRLPSVYKKAYEEALIQVKSELNAKNKEKREVLNKKKLQGLPKENLEPPNKGRLGFPIRKT